MLLSPEGAAFISSLTTIGLCLEKAVSAVNHYHSALHKKFNKVVGGALG
jgi:hypothetical protein